MTHRSVLVVDDDPHVLEVLEMRLAARRWARDRDLLRSVGDELASSSVVEHVLEVVAARTLEATETERAIVFLRQEGRIVPCAIAGASPVPIEEIAARAEATIAQA